MNGPTFIDSKCSLTNPVCEHDPVFPSEDPTPVNKDFWLLMAKLKDFPSGKKKSIDACSDANGHNGTNLLIELALRLTQ